MLWKYKNLNPIVVSVGFLYTDFEPLVLWQIAKKFGKIFLKKIIFNQPDLKAIQRSKQLLPPAKKARMPNQYAYAYTTIPKFSIELHVFSYTIPPLISTGRHNSYTHHEIVCRQSKYLWKLYATVCMLLFMNIVC